MSYLATAYEQRNGVLKPLQVKIDPNPGDGPAEIRKKAIDRLMDEMGPGRRPTYLVGFQVWNCGGITWYPIKNEPLFCSELTLDEIMSR